MRGGAGEGLMAEVPFDTIADMAVRSFDRRGFIVGAAALAMSGCCMPRCACRRGPIRLRKLGTFDIFIVEANPIVFKGKLWLMEYIRWERPDKKYRFNDTGDSYFRFLDMGDMKTVTPSFG